MIAWQVVESGDLGEESDNDGISSPCGRCIRSGMLIVLAWQMKLLQAPANYSVDCLVSVNFGFVSRLDAKPHNYNTATAAPSTERPHLVGGPSRGGGLIVVVVYSVNNNNTSHLSSRNLVPLPWYGG